MHNESSPHPPSLCGGVSIGSCGAQLTRAITKYCVAMAVAKMVMPPTLRGQEEARGALVRARLLVFIRL